MSVLTETVPPPPMIDPGATGVRHGFGDAHGQGVLDSVLGSNLVLPPPLPAVRHPPVSHMMEGNLIYRVQPRYPALAIQARVQGQVVLRAMISREGAIENLQVLSGPGMLAPAALDAVRQWRYRPLCAQRRTCGGGNPGDSEFRPGGRIDRWPPRLGSSTGVTSWAAGRPL